MIDAELLADCRKLALEIAPELEGADFHVLLHNPVWPLPSGVRAYATTNRLLTIRKALIASGDWNGTWGSYIVLTPELNRQEAFGLLIHELAHLVPARPSQPAAEPTVDEAIAQCAILQNWATREVDGNDPWAAHGARWIRRALHLHQRAEWLGYAISLEQVHIAGPCYALSTGHEYRDELGYDPRIMQGRTFAEIDAAPLFPQFARLFANDVARWTYNTLMEI